MSIKRKKLADSVIEEIARMIQSGELKAGDKLPNQNEFAAQLGVSRPSLREALHTLALIGVIEQRPGLGTVIKSDKPTQWVEYLSPPLVADVEAIRELVDVRRYIEVGGAELAARRATKEELVQMGRLIQDMAGALRDGRPDEYTDLDMTFHFQVANASHNRLMVHLFVTIRGLMEQFMRETFMVLPKLLERSLTFHRLIYEGLAEHNVQKAADAMKRHIADIGRALDEYYQNDHNRK